MVLLEIKANGDSIRIRHLRFSCLGPLEEIQLDAWGINGGNGLIMAWSFHIPRIRFDSSPFSVFWLASPGCPRSGSSSPPLASFTGLDSGMPVAEDMMDHKLDEQ